MKYSPFRIGVFIAALAIPVTSGCGSAEPIDNETAAATQEGVTSCTPPYQLFCPPPPPDSSVKYVCLCLPPVPPASETRLLVPDYVVTNVVYAPPGKSSSITYSSTSSTGSTVSATSGFDSSVKVTAEASATLYASASLSVSAEHSQGSSTSDALDLSQTWSQGYKKSGQVDGIDHNYDEIWFLIHPLLISKFQPAGKVASQPASEDWSFGQGDGINTDIPMFVYAGWLNNAMQMPADVRNTLDYYGITPEKYAALLGNDPLFTGIVPNQTMDPNRFEYVGVYPFEPPFAAGNMPSSQTFSLDRKSTSSTTTQSQSKYTVGLSASAGGDIGLVKAKLTVSSQWTWSHSSSDKESTGTGSTDSFTIGQPAFGYAGPILVHVYRDRIWDTWAFTLDNPQGETNLALGMPSYQSTDDPGYGAVAARANDGNTDGNFWDGSVSLTDYGLWSNVPGWPGQYWFVDLGSERVVDAVNIYNRTDAYTELDSHYNILVYNEIAGTWDVISDHSADDVTGIVFLRSTFPMVRTRYVMVAKTDANNLQLAEVQVMGY